MNDEIIYKMPATYIISTDLSLSLHFVTVSKSVEDAAHSQTTTHWLLRIVFSYGIKVEMREDILHTMAILQFANPHVTSRIFPKKARNGCMMSNHTQQLHC